MHNLGGCRNTLVRTLDQKRHTAQRHTRPYYKRTSKKKTKTSSSSPCPPVVLIVPSPHRQLPLRRTRFGVQLLPAVASVRSSGRTAAHDYSRRITGKQKASQFSLSVRSCESMSRPALTGPSYHFQHHKKKIAHVRRLSVASQPTSICMTLKKSAPYNRSKCLVGGSQPTPKYKQHSVTLQASATTRYGTTVRTSSVTRSRRTVGGSPPLPGHPRRALRPPHRRGEAPRCRRRFRRRKGNLLHHGYRYRRRHSRAPLHPPSTPPATTIVARLSRTRRTRRCTDGLSGPSSTPLPPPVFFAIYLQERNIRKREKKKKVAWHGIGSEEGGGFFVRTTLLVQ